MKNINKKPSYVKPHVILSVVETEKCNKLESETSQPIIPEDKIQQEIVSELSK